MNNLLAAWDQSTVLPELIDQGGGGVPDNVRPFTVAGLSRRAPVTLVVLSRSRDAEAFVASMAVWLAPEDVCLFPAWEVLPGEAMSPTLETMGRRVKILKDLAHGTPPRVIVTSVRALVQAVADPPSSSIVVRRGTEVSMDETVGRLVEFGFERNYLIERRGEFSVRGGLLDIFPADLPEPVRVEFFGDEVSDLRTFAVSSQRSGPSVDRVEVTPCRELRLDLTVRQLAADLLKKRQPEQVREDLEKLSEGLVFPGMEAYLSFLAGPLKPLTEFLPGGSQIVICDPKQCRDRSVDFAEQAAGWGGPESEGLFVPFDDVAAGPDVIELWPYGRGDEGIDLDVTGWDDHAGRPQRLAAAISELRAQGGAVMIAAGATSSRAREIMAEAGLGLPIAEPELDRAVITEASLGKGFLLRLPGAAPVGVIGETDLFGRRRPVSAASGPAQAARATALVLQLAADDYVVHETYGVGRYHGMVTREIGGVSRDYLIISYASGDKLYLPTEQLDAITKYTGGEAPKLNRLGTGEWEKSKTRARKAVADIAKDLIRLYSTRIRAAGHAFSPDTPWQTELENAFPHIETPDQQRAIDDVKADMERPVPMDRLVCGDVGYGKTEVAVRAAFKAVQDSKQVAVLVPTTILAQQHHQTFSERFGGFPVRVAQLSRFLTQSQQAEVLEGVKTGKVDVVVGTHRLLQGDIKFHDLGLLVVDEEQRFGVKNKEKIKQLREHVDVLTMTATPIPRTLEMGLTGIRDLSMMDTPPLDRRPVMTYVGDFDNRMVAAAIRRELARDGQVFFVHNRVSSIKASARRIAALVPGARVAIAHGQMTESELEEVMVEVGEGKIDILVCTTIIESGLDIPAMNTLIVERADLLGLAQLYQLRGRVGRAKERAYAYFFYPHETVLTDEAHERLKTLSEFTELGSGFKIALRDLELRGAGNMLGAEQSGHIAAVGFDLYIRMMNEAITALSGRTEEPKLKVKLDIPADAYIPADYIARESLRMEAYRQIEQVRSPEDVVALIEELTDRYGPVPKSLTTLLTVAQLRAYLAGQGITDAAVRDGVLKLRQVPALAESQQMRLKRKHKGSIYKEVSGTLLMTVPATDVPHWVLESLRDILEPK